MIKLSRLVKSFIYALRGLLKVIREEQNLKIQMTVGLIAIIIAFWLDISRMEWAFIITAIFLVILMEIINSAVERITDVLKPRINWYVKEIKDIAAAGVIVASIGAFIVGIIILGPYLIKKIIY
ncbi:hypothetical protein AUJ27_03920 [Candidatus Falkowbacteria bacterium CG1_02_37_44]|uniref:Diacylglycerol kinase n=2 Tax=Candidatus Falkowiibacteriota TaxID=1752728 RepID=A0A1J4T4X9_9BACT|nr:MAG: hypothetical protein AUJ27_03920 [Candidatus Falkowbacteria bacterium CG1_02_37_44]PIV52150.1 MAG: diacylglycerol kinase [Candidatus Falkowbacteria bacterium CG02_land_8_20_14_3_00_36_14]PIX12250.1 MAG: diacylglycerol kinase [Candidatus Falkowbacteria bacterium CG_4_8_14_3_um_filter_36_11]